MKANFFLLALFLFFSLLSALTLTSSEYIQCNHPVPAEFLDLSGILKNSLLTLTGSTFHKDETSGIRPAVMLNSFQHLMPWRNVL
jgi:hypothetical protein